MGLAQRQESWGILPGHQPVIKGGGTRCNFLDTSMKDGSFSQSLRIKKSDKPEANLPQSTLQLLISSGNKKDIYLQVTEILRLF